MQFNDENTPRIVTVGDVHGKWLARAAQDGQSIVILEEAPGDLIAHVYEVKHARWLVQFPALVQTLKNLLAENDYRTRAKARTILAALEDR